MKRILKYLLWALAAYLLYVVVTGVLPFARQPRVAEEDRYAAGDFYGSAPCCDRVALVEEPRTGLAARLFLMSQARETLDVSYYALQMDSTTDLFLGALLDAADRGVRVRLLVDGFAGGLTHLHPVYARAIGAHPNITLRLYNPPDPLRPWTFNGRLHDKYILIDDKLVLLGGRNIGDRYFGPEGYGAGLSIDRDVLVYNTAYASGGRESVLFAVRDYMDGIWTGENVTQPFDRDSGGSAALREQLTADFRALRAQQPSLFDTQVDFAAGTFAANKVTFVHNGADIGPKAPAVAQALKEALGAARESCVLQSPYVVPGEDLCALLAQLAAGPADCRVLTNSLASTPNLPAFSAYVQGRQSLLDTGAAFYEYQSDDAIHAKTYIVDGRLSAVGSFNLDPRSTYLDTELLLFIDSEDFAADLLAVQQRYFDRSLQVGPVGEYLPRDGVEAVPVSTFKRVLVSAVGFLGRPLRFLV